jgi:hypothetical protein
MSLLRDRQNETGRRGLAKEDRQNRTGRTGQAEGGGQKMTGRARLPDQDYQDKNAKQNCQNRTVRTR